MKAKFHSIAFIKKSLPRCHKKYRLPFEFFNCFVAEGLTVIVFQYLETVRGFKLLFIQSFKRNRVSDINLNTKKYQQQVECILKLKIAHVS